MDRHLFWIASDATGRKQAATFYVGTAAELDALVGTINEGDVGWATDNGILYVYSSGAWAQSAGMNPTFDSVTVNNDVGVFAGQGGGWDDMLGQIAARTVGAGNPAWSRMGATNYWAYKFALNDVVWVTYHIPHGYAPGTDIYFHAHWTTDGTKTDSVKWEFDYTYAKGYDQDNFDMSANTQSKALAANGTAWRHMISEIATPVSDSTFEVDGLIMMRIKRVTNGGTDNTDGVFLLMADCHIQTDTINTKNRNYPFYT